MQYGRDHDERQQKAARSRNQNLPKDSDTELEREMNLSGRTGARPREGLVGAHVWRASHSIHEWAPGSEYAPTWRATERERERHRVEREIGRVAAGTQGKLRDERSPSVTREQLDEAARRADRVFRRGS